MVRFSRFEISPNLLRNSIQQPWSENSFSRFSNIPSTLSPSPPDFLQYFLKFEVTVAANDFPGNFFPRPRMNAFQLTAVLGSFVIEFRPDVPPPLLSVSKSRRAFDRGGFPYFATRVYTSLFFPFFSNNRSRYSQVSFNGKIFDNESSPSPRLSRSILKLDCLPLAQRYSRKGKGVKAANLYHIHIPSNSRSNFFRPLSYFFPETRCFHAFNIFHLSFTNDYPSREKILPETRRPIV